MLWHSYKSTADSSQALKASSNQVFEWRGPNSFTALVPVDGVDCSALHERLETVSKQVLHHVKDIKDMHSFRLCAIPRDPIVANATTLLINSVHDRPTCQHIEELVACIGDLLRSIMQTTRSSMPNDSLVRLLFEKREIEDTLYLGAINRSVRQILGENLLKEDLQKYLDQNRCQLSSGMSPEAIRRQIRENLLNSPRASVRSSVNPLSWRQRLVRGIARMINFVAMPFVSILSVEIRKALNRRPNSVMRFVRHCFFWLWYPYGMLFGGLGLIGVQLLEKLEPEDSVALPDEKRVRQLEAREDRGPKNVVTLVFNVRNSWMRRQLLKLVLMAAKFGVRYVWTDGRLAGISTIHYARLIQVNQGRQLLFMSDYDGGLNRYLDEFLSIGKIAVLPITSNMVGCPKTRRLVDIGDSSDFSPRWKLMIRCYQWPNAVWYNAYPDLTVDEIHNNAEIRAGIFAASLTDKEAQTWLRRF